MSTDMILVLVSLAVGFGLGAFTMYKNQKGVDNTVAAASDAVSKVSTAVKAVETDIKKV